MIQSNVRFAMCVNLTNNEAITYREVSNVNNANNRSRFKFLLILLSLFIFGAAVLGFAKITTIGTDEAYELLQSRKGDADFVILDVRTPGEYADGHIEGSVNVDFYTETFRDDLNSLDKSKTYLVYCRTGSRSSGALGIMKDLGFRNVFNMAGGITKWQRKYPIVR